MFAVLIGATTMLAASAGDFYESAFRGGVAAFEAGTYDVALARLRIAAFGFVEDLPRYETAQAYIAVAARRLDRTAEAKSALLRILFSERVARHFASLQLAPALRGAVEEAAKALLTPQQAAQLTKPPGETRTETIVVPDPVVVKPAPPVPQAERDAAVRLAEAGRALEAGNLRRARTEYTAILASPSLSHATLLKSGEGMCRSHDFAGAVRAFERAGEFARGEEPYRYYFAVALYERGRNRDAKRELAAALPYIEATPDVQRYRSKIEHSLD